MSWKTYKLTYLAPGPVHAGFREIGNVVRTRYYIPASTIWGAVTAQLTRSIFPAGHPQMPLLYQIIGDYVKENLRFGYFFPTEEGIIYRPKFERNAEKYGSLSRDQFERKFITSIATTALEVSAEEGATTKQTFAAEEGSLHEMEIMTAKKTPAGDWAKLQFFGYAYFKIERPFKSEIPDVNELKKLENDDFVLEQIQEIIAGGERKYGFGKLVLEKCEEENESKDLIPAELCKNNVDSEIYFASHVPFISEKKLEISGPIEPYVCRVWGNGTKTSGKGPGQSYSVANVCWVPGCKLESYLIDSIRVGVGGMWEII